MHVLGIPAWLRLGVQPSPALPGELSGNPGKLVSFSPTVPLFGGISVASHISLS